MTDLELRGTSVLQRKDSDNISQELSTKVGNWRQFMRYGGGQAFCWSPQLSSDVAICPIPPRGESDAHLGFALSVKIMLICSNLPTDAQTGSTRPEQREKTWAANDAYCTTVSIGGLYTKKISKPLYKAFKLILVV